MGGGRPIGLPPNNEDTQCDKYESIDHQSTWAAALLSFARLLNFLSKRESSASSVSGAIAYGAAYGFQLLQIVNPVLGSGFAFFIRAANHVSDVSDVSFWLNSASSMSETLRFQCLGRLALNRGPETSETLCFQRLGLRTVAIEPKRDIRDFRDFVCK